MQDWGTEVSVTVEQLNKAAGIVGELRKEYETRKAFASEAEKELSAAEENLVKLLEASGNTKFFAPGVGTVSLITKMSVTTPKDIHEKKEFFKFLEDKYGEEGLYTYATVNYNSLNSLYNQLLEESNEPALFSVPGVGAPTAKVSLRLTRS